MISPEQNLWDNVLAIAIQDSLRVPQPLPDYPVDDRGSSQWKKVKEARSRIKRDNNSISGGKEYVRILWDGKAALKELEEMWDRLDKEPSLSLDYRRQFNARVGDKSA